MTSLAKRFQPGPNTEEQFRASSALGWEPKPRPGLPIDDHGFLGLHDPSSKRANAEVRILFIGDSLGAGLIGSPELSAWEAFLSRAWHKDVKLWSFAAGGYRLAHFYRILRFKADRVRPDVVILSFCPLDPYQGAPIVLLQNGGLYVIQGFHFNRDDTVIPVLFRHSQLYRFLWLGRQARAGEAFTHPDDASFAGIVSLCRRENIKLVAVVWPFFLPAGRASSAGDIPAFARDGRQVILGWLARNRVPFIDLQKEFPPGYGKLYHDPSPDDDIHPNAAGYHQASKLILKFLSAQAP